MIRSLCLTQLFDIFSNTKSHTIRRMKMTTFTIRTFDRELAQEILKLKINDGIIRPGVEKAEGSPYIIIIQYIGLAASLITFATFLFNLIKSKQKGSQEKTKTIICTQKNTVDLRELTASYEESIYIEIQEKD